MFAAAFISSALRCLRGCVIGARSKSPDSFESRSECGAALVEFTILMPVFFLLLFGMVEFGSMLWLQNNMTNAAREGLRTATVRGDTMANARAMACQCLAGAGQIFTITSTDQCPGNQDATMTVTVPTANASLFNAFFQLSSGSLTSSAWNGTMTANVTMRRENTCGASVGQASCTCDTTGNAASGCGTTPRPCYQ